MDTTPVKDVLRFVYRKAVGAATMAALALRRRNGELYVFYGGARAGDFGGPLVKVQLLQSRFPQHLIGFSLLYVLSNAIYLSRGVVEQTQCAGVPVVLNQNGVFYPAWFAEGWEHENARMADVHAIADHVFYQSEFCRRCAKKFLGPREGKAETLYNAVDVNFFTPATTSPRNDVFTFLVSGKFSPSTAHRLSSSLAGLSAARKGGLNVRLQIAGPIDPRVEMRLCADAERLNLSDAVTLSGPYRRQEAPMLYQSADAYLITKQNDPCPNAVLEALACGLPVLYSASGGVPELVGDSAGIGLSIAESFETIIVPGPHAIAEGMAQIVRARDRMANEARKRAVALFNLEHWLDRHGMVFEQLLASR